MRLLPPSFDLGSTAVRAVRLAEASGSVHLANYVDVPLPEGAMKDDGRVLNEAAVGEAIRQALSGLGIRRRFGGISCIANMPARLSAIASYDLSAMSDSKRAKRAAELRAAEFAKEEPLSKVDDCSVTVVERAGGSSRHLVIKTLREALRERQRVFSRAGCNAVIEHEAFSLLRAVPNASAIIDIGYKRTLFAARNADGIPICQMLSFGGYSIEQRVAIGARMDKEEAQARMYREGVSADSSAEWALQQFVDDVKATINGLATKENLPITRIALVGNGSRIPGLDERIADVTTRTVNYATIDDLNSDAFPSGVLRDAGPTLALSIGLALWNAPQWVESRIANADSLIAPFKVGAA